MGRVMLTVVNAMSEEQRKFVTQSWRPDTKRLFIDTLDELVILSEDEKVFQHIKVSLGALKGDGRIIDDEDLDGPDEI